MAQPPTYVQLLAEVYEENAKSNLIFQQEFENERVEAFEDEDLSDNELEDRDEFNKFHGNRDKPEHVIKPKATTTQAGKVSYGFNKHIRTYGINIDGRFIGGALITKPVLSCNTSPIQIAGQNTAYFAFIPSRQYSNIYSITLSSFEFYNNFFTFSAARGNNTFIFTNLVTNVSHTITIADGNYIIADPAIVSPDGPSNTPPSQPVYNNLLYILEREIQLIYNNTFSVSIDAVTNLITFWNTDPYASFSITFPTTADSVYKNGMGYNLGFIGTSYTSYPQLGPGDLPSRSEGLLFPRINAETFPDAVQDTYVYLRINDWFLVKHQNADQTEFGAFLKIPLNSAKNTIQFMSSTTNTTAREYFFQQPTNITNFEIQILDALGTTLNMNGSTFSLTLELQEVLQSDIYEKMLEL